MSGRVERADDVVVGGQARAGDAVRDHLGIAQHRLAGEQRAARGGGEIGREDEIAGDLDHAAGMDDAHRDARLVRREAGEVGLGADDGEGAAIDLGAVAGVVVLRAHASASCSARSAATICSTLSPVRAGVSPARPLRTRS